VDSFEGLVKLILENEGYWVRERFKVELTKSEKRKIGKPSSPRWELDLLAYKPKQNKIFVVECCAPVKMWTGSVVSWVQQTH